MGLYLKLYREERGECYFCHYRQHISKLLESEFINLWNRMSHCNIPGMYFECTKSFLVFLTALFVS